jgi:hypothetical protein
LRYEKKNSSKSRHFSASKTRWIIPTQEALIPEKNFSGKLSAAVLGFQRGRTRPKVKGKMSKSGQNKKNRREISLKQRPSGSRPMKVVVDGKGNPWICDCQVDPSKDLAEQGCWQLREEGSTQSKERRLRRKRRKIS